MFARNRFDEFRDFIEGEIFQPLSKSGPNLQNDCSFSAYLVLLTVYNQLQVSTKIFKCTSTISNIILLLQFWVLPGWQLVF